MQSTERESHGSGLDALKSHERSKTPSLDQSDHGRPDVNSSSGQQTYLYGDAGDDTEEAPGALSSSISSSRRGSIAFGKWRTTDIASPFERLNRHQNSDLFPSISRQTDPGRQRAHSADATLSREITTDTEKVDVIDQFKEDHPVQHHPSLTRLRSKSEADLTAAQRPPFRRNWFSEGGGESKQNRRYYQKLENKVQRYQTAARKKCTAVNPAFCRIHGAIHQSRNTRLQNVRDVDISATDLEGFGLVSGIHDIFELKEICGTRLPSEATTVSDVETGLEPGIPVRQPRRRQRESLHWEILCSPYWWLLLVLMLVSIGVEVSRQLHTYKNA